jgi:hypothetical protein
VPLKVIQERLGHASGGPLTLDVYTHFEREENVEAAQLAAEQIEKAVNSVCLTVESRKGLPTEIGKPLSLSRIAGCGGWI